MLANELQQKLATAVATGQSYAKTAREIRERFNVKQSYAERPIHTESCHFETEASLQAYRDMGIDEIVFVATLDTRTSEVCQHADGKRIKLADAVAGENIPPLHPNCRSTIRAYIGDDFEPTERWDNEAQDVIAQTTYREWAKAYGYGASTGKILGKIDGVYIQDGTPEDALKGWYIGLDKAGIEYNEVEDLAEPLTDEQIIVKLSGGDKTLGSCQSLALAYAANKLGLDVLDFRGGKSQDYFSSPFTLSTIAKK